ncbi:MAG: CidA/LrgA family protein [Desulfitobacteriia bacterium]|jgi:holin-like protein
MKYIKQFCIILFICLIGELLSYFIPLPIPASIYGFLIMLLALKSKFLKLDLVRETGEFLIGIMAVMFIPPAVGLLESWSILKEILLPVIVITVVITVFVMVVSGQVTQFIIRWEKRAKQ